MQSKTNTSIKWDGLEESFHLMRAGQYSRPFVVVDEAVASSDRMRKLLGNIVPGAVVGGEPTTEQVNDACERIHAAGPFSSVIGIGGGSSMDLAKAIAVTATNGGRAERLQGWELPKEPGLPVLVVPTIPGTGAEISRTAVLKGPVRKLGINSDFTIPKDCIVDPSLFSTVDVSYGVPTLMDCYIHCVEVVSGRFSDSYAVWIAEDIIERFQDILREPYDPSQRRNAELYAYCSYLGGLGLLGGVVGACHGLSYGLSHALKVSHSYANVVAMDALEDYYGDEVGKVRAYCAMNAVDCWKNLASHNAIDANTLPAIAEGALFMEKLWSNAARADSEALPRARRTIEQFNRILEHHL